MSEQVAHSFHSPIVLVLPAEPRLIRLARLMASGVATALGLTLDEVADLRLAVDEVCAALVEAASGQPITLTFAVVDGSLVVTGHSAGGTEIDERRLSISREILDVVVDEQSLSSRDGTVRFRIVRELRAPGVG